MKLMLGCAASPTPRCCSISWRSGLSSQGPRGIPATSSVWFCTTAWAICEAPSRSTGRPVQLSFLRVFVSLMYRASFRMPSFQMRLSEMSRSVTQSYFRSHSSRKTKSSSSSRRLDTWICVSCIVRKREKSMPGFVGVSGPMAFTVRMTHWGLFSRLCARALAPSFSTSFRLKLSSFSEEFIRRKCARKMAPTTSMPYIPWWLSKLERFSDSISLSFTFLRGTPLQNSRKR
mmetsp:Transcript_49626/g.146664  ORF Transcript_49626/g.146664 Transcript_49626/m.146664 type:complete len:231 (-) Transcript_49626:330-1022(-)